MPNAAPASFRASTNLPEPISELIGRDAQLVEILTLCETQRLVTLAGAGGIGKTRLGFEVARRQLPNFTDGVWAVELALLSDPDLVPVTVATALGVELSSGATSPQSVAYALRSRQFMLLLDNCEHVIDAAARMAEALLRINPAAHVIATRRAASHSGQTGSGFIWFRRSLSRRKAAWMARTRFAMAPSACLASEHAAARQTYCLTRA
jgi:hypothetical protein